MTEATMSSLRTLMTLGRFSRMRPRRPSRAYSTSSVIPGLATNSASLTRSILSDGDRVPAPGSGGGLQGKEVLLGSEPAGIPGESARGGNHAVTGQHDTQRVCPQGRSDRAGGAGAFDLPGQCAVCRPLTVADRIGQVPEDDALERRAQDEHRRQVEVSALAAQVGVQLSSRLVEGPWRAQHPR